VCDSVITTATRTNCSASLTSLTHSNQQQQLRQLHPQLQSPQVPLLRSRLVSEQRSRDDDIAIVFPPGRVSQLLGVISDRKIPDNNNDTVIIKSIFVKCHKVVTSDTLSYSYCFWNFYSIYFTVRPQKYDVHRKHACLTYVALHLLKPHTVALSSQTGPRFSLGGSRLSPQERTLTCAAITATHSPSLPFKWFPPL